MKQISSVITQGLLFIFIGFTPLALAQGQAHQPFALVELYTSEGCSSCPPAEDLLAQITEAAQKSKSNILTLSFHVDYWNNLGWVDPYSSKNYTKRQRRYAAAHDSKRIYTPQMIVNGEVGFSGFNLDIAKRTIDKFLSQPALFDINLRVKPSRDTKELSVDYRVKGNIQKHNIAIALVEHKIINFVKLGENAGKLLRHRNVVRSFKTVTLREEEGTVKILFPEELNLETTSIVGFVQDSKSMQIQGANRIGLQ